MDDLDLPPELQEIADLLWEHAHGAPPVEDDPVWWMLCTRQWEQEKADE